MTHDDIIIGPGVSFLVSLDVGVGFNGQGIQSVDAVVVDGQTIEGDSQRGGSGGNGGWMTDGLHVAGRVGDGGREEKVSCHFGCEIKADIEVIVPYVVLVGVVGIPQEGA